MSSNRQGKIFILPNLKANIRRENGEKNAEQQEDIPYTISLSPAITRLKPVNAFKVVYWAGYSNVQE